MLLRSRESEELQDRDGVRREQARQLYHRFVEHWYTYHAEDQDRMVREIRQFSPWYGMIAHRFLMARRRRERELSEETARTRAHKLTQRRKNKLLLEQTLGGCAPIREWPPECRRKPKPRGTNWPKNALGCPPDAAKVGERKAKP